MMTRFNNKIGAAVLVGLGLVYMVSALVAGHSAAAVSPPDLGAPKANLDVWRALALMAGHPGRVEIIDVRRAEHFSLYHLPGAVSLPGAGADEVAARMGDKHALVVAQKDADAAKLVGAVKAEVGKERGAKAHFLAGGANAWYLALEVPVPLFAAKPPPFAYAKAIVAVKRWLKVRGEAGHAEAAAAAGVLSTIDYQPTQLQGKPKPKASGKKKKIAGGCG